MEARGPLRSPDGLWFWDGKAWQPIASLAVPPPPPPAPPAPVPAQPTERVLLEGARQPLVATPPSEFDPWQPPPASQQPSAPTFSPAPATPSPTDWQPPPPAAVQAPPVPPPAAPPPPPTSERPAPDAAWPNWLPRNERSEAVVEDVPIRVDPGALKPPAPASRAAIASVQVPGEARSSSWVSQLYPASAALTANRRLVTYVVLGILGLFALYVLFQVLSNAGLFGGSGGATTPDSGPTGTQFQQADGYLSGSLSPALRSVAGATKTIPVDCAGTHSVTCRNTLQDADATVVGAISGIDQGTFPGCISASVVQTRRDLAIQEQALKAALIGFRTNNDDLVSKGIADYTAAAPALKVDGAALQATAKSACPKTP